MYISLFRTFRSNAIFLFNIFHLLAFRSGILFSYNFSKVFNGMFSIFPSTNSSITYYFIFPCSIHSDILQEKSPGVLVRFFEKRFAGFLPPEWRPWLRLQKSQKAINNNYFLLAFCRQNGGHGFAC